MQWPRLPLSDQVQAADWIRDSLHPFAQDVGSVVAILNDPAIEALETSPADGITYDIDKINS